MHMVYFESDFFNVDADPCLADALQGHSQRKPSYDQLVNPLFQDNNVNIQTQTHSEDSSSPLKIKEKKVKNTKRKRENVKNLPQGMQRGHWDSQEHKRYHWFLQLFANHFLQKHLRRMDKIFKSMEKFVITREAQQCRSHHQKMQKKHGNFVSILRQLRMLNYNCLDGQVVQSDMQANGVQVQYDLLDWANLEVRKEENIDEMVSNKSPETHQGIPESGFVDPLMLMQDEHQIFLEGLIL